MMKTRTRASQLLTKSKHNNLKASKIIDGDEGELIYIQNFFKTDYFQPLQHEIAWKCDQIKFFGKTHLIPRLQSWHADEGVHYSYSKISLTSHPWSASLIEIKHLIESYSNLEFNGVLCNLYRSGLDHNSWHSDDEKELGERPSIASASFGETRVFELRKKADHQVKTRIKLEDRSLLLMLAPIQRYWQHRIVKTSKSVDPRINLTFRQILL